MVIAACEMFGGICGVRPREARSLGMPSNSRPSAPHARSHSVANEQARRTTRARRVVRNNLGTRDMYPKQMGVRRHRGHGHADGGLRGDDPHHVAHPRRPPRECRRRATRGFFSGSPDSNDPETHQRVVSLFLATCRACFVWHTKRTHAHVARGSGWEITHGVVRGRDKTSSGEQVARGLIRAPSPIVRVFRNPTAPSIKITSALARAGDGRRRPPTRKARDGVQMMDREFSLVSEDGCRLSVRGPPRVYDRGVLWRAYVDTSTSRVGTYRTWEPNRTLETFPVVPEKEIANRYP